MDGQCGTISRLRVLVRVPISRVDSLVVDFRWHCPPVSWMFSGWLMLVERSGVLVHSFLALVVPGRKLVFM